MSSQTTQDERPAGRPGHANKGGNTVSQRTVEDTGGGLAATLPPVRTQVRTRRRPALILAAVAAMVVAGLLALLVVNSTQTQSKVIMVRHNISRGATISTEDLSAVTVGATGGASTVDAGQIRSLVGQRATVDLKAGAMLPSGAIGAQTIPASGKSLVGIKMEAGRIVAGGIPAGSKVRLIVTPASTDDGNTTNTNGTPTAYPALMSTGSTTSSDGAATVINVEVPTGQAAQIASLAAQGRLAIVKDSDR